MFKINKKKQKEIRDESEKQYKELLKESGYDENSTGFILGEKKEIYDKDVSLEDIINKITYNK